jgi:addiction module HigA family antidote
MIKRGLEPSHPGEILKDLYLEPLGLTQEEAANNLGVTRKTLSLLLNGRQGISAEMALRLSKAFKTSTLLWLNLQNTYDLWYAKKNLDLSKIKAFPILKGRPLEAEVLKKYAKGNQ